MIVFVVPLQYLAIRLGKAKEKKMITIFTNKVGKTVILYRTTFLDLLGYERFFYTVVVTKKYNEERISSRLVVFIFNNFPSTESSLNGNAIDIVLSSLSSTALLLLLSTSLSSSYTVVE
jgi:hypothetical protein